MRIVLIKIVRFLEDGLEPPLTYDEANKRLLLLLLKLENVFMKHYALNHMLAPKEGSSQKGV